MHSYDAALGGSNTAGVGRVAERAFVTRLAHYMARALDCPARNDREHVRVDAEYNRREFDKKDPPPGADKEAMTVDLCVHIRRNDTKNVFVLEVKPVFSPGAKDKQEQLEDDRGRLRWLTKQKDQEGQFCYSLGALWTLDGYVQWFEAGEMVGVAESLNCSFIT